MAGNSAPEEQPRTVEVVGDRVVTVSTDPADRTTSTDGTDPADRTNSTDGTDPADRTSSADGTDPAELARETTTRTMGFECSSGDWVEGSWTGFEVAELVEAAGVPNDTTHLVVESDDGYRGCVALDACLDGLLALAGEVEPDASDRDTIDQAGFPRLVAPSLYGPRAVKNVSRIEPASLAPGEDPERYENWQPDESADPSA